MSGNNTGVPSMAYDHDQEDDGEKKVYVKLSLAKYPFLKSKKVNEKGKASFKGEIEQSERQDDDSIHHTVCIQDLSSGEKARRV